MSKEQYEAQTPAVSYYQSDSSRSKVDCDSSGNKAGPDPVSQQLGQSSYQIICGDSREVVQSLLQVQGVVTSPPYWSQRQYCDSKQEIGVEDDAVSYLTEPCDYFDAVPLHPRGTVSVNLGDKRSPNDSLLNIPVRFSIIMQDRGWRLVDHVTNRKVRQRTGRISVIDNWTEGFPLLRNIPFETYMRDVSEGLANQQQR